MSNIQTVEQFESSVKDYSKRRKAAEKLLRSMGYHLEHMDPKKVMALYEMAMIDTTPKGRAPEPGTEHFRYFEFEAHVLGKRSALKLVKSIRKRFHPVYSCEVRQIQETVDVCAVSLILPARIEVHEHIHIAGAMAEVALQVGSQLEPIRCLTSEEAGKVGAPMNPMAPMASANSPTCGHPKLGQARTAGL